MKKLDILIKIKLKQIIRYFSKNNEYNKKINK